MVLYELLLRDVITKEFVGGSLITGQWKGARKVLEKD